MTEYRDHTGSYLLDIVSASTEERWSIYRCDTCFALVASEDIADHGQRHVVEDISAPTPGARLYAREFAAKQLRKAATWAETEGYDEAAVDHLISKSKELWP